MRATVTVRTTILLLAVAICAPACDGGSDDDRECRPCTTSEVCENDQECVLAVDGAQRCFELDRDTCELDRVPVGRAPTPAPTP